MKPRKSSEETEKETDADFGGMMLTARGIVKKQFGGDLKSRFDIDEGDLVECVYDYILAADFNEVVVETQLGRAYELAKRIYDDQFPNPNAVIGIYERRFDPFGDNE